MKKLLCVLVVVSVLAIPCLAITNTVDGHYSVSVYARDSYDTLANTFTDVLDYGSTYLVEFVSPIGYLSTPYKIDYTFSVPFTVEADSRVVLCTYNYLQGAFNLNSFGTPVHSSTVSMSSDKGLRLSYNYDWNYVVTSTPSSSHNFTINEYSLSPGTYSLQFSSSFGDSTGNIIGIGIFVDDGSGTFTPLPSDNTDSVSNGSLDLASALNILNEETNELINNASSYDEATFYVTYNQMLTENYINVSNSNVVSTIKSGGALYESINSIKEDYISHTIPLETAMERYNTSFKDALSNANTPEEVACIGEWYAIQLDDLGYESCKEVKREYEEIIDDDDTALLNNVQSYEDDLISRLDQIHIDDYLDVNNWITQLDGVSLSFLREIMNFYLTESCIKWFILIPLYLGIVALLLGTTIHTIGTNKSISRINKSSPSPQPYPPPNTGYFNMTGGRHR